VRVTAATARRILRRQGMPPREIRAVLAANDPLVVRRLLELHRERLGEWLEEQQRLIASIERLYGVASSRYGAQIDVVSG
jgi:DNA-binding transcriptional MerR regulator